MKQLAHKDALPFIFAGKSVFTVINPNTGNEFTFKVTRSKDEKFFFIKVLMGKTVDTFTYLGTVAENGYRHGKKSTIASDAQSTKVFEYVFNKLRSKTLPDFIEIRHNGRCGRCGRTLTVNESIDMGIGPECIKMLNKQEKRDAILNLLLA